MGITQPKPDHYPGVYWFWHRIPDRDEIRAQIQNMFDSEIRTFLIQPRLSFPRDQYLSEAYFAAYQTAMEEAKARGMKAGIYDDYNWDSGQAGGRTVELNDQARERHLFWTTGIIKNRSCTCTITNIHSLMYSGMGEAVLEWIYEEGTPEWNHWHTFRVLAFPNQAHIDDLKTIVDLTEYCSIEKTGKTSCKLNIDLPNDRQIEGYQVAAFLEAVCTSSRLINYLSADAVDAFIAAGYESYRKYLGEFFGDPIEYLFFDHPYGGFYDWQERTGNLGNSLMFDPALPEVFLAERGNPLEIALLSFLAEIPSLTPKYRCDFFETYGGLGRRNFFGKISDWAKTNGLGLSGHELLPHVGSMGLNDGFPFLDARTNFAVDYFDIDSYRTQTAVDACNLDPQISAKIGDSAAKANGRRGCLIEQYCVAKTAGVPGGAGQWEMTLGQMRRQAIRHYLFGASQFIFHAYYQTDGSGDNLDLYQNPRFDFAPGINYEPWFKMYPLFANEMRNLAEILYDTKANPTVAMLYPMRTWWAEGPEHCFSGESRNWFTYLMEKNIQFDLISEEQLEKATIENGTLIIGEDQYETLIFPGISTLKSKKIINQVSALVDSGGRFIASGCLPRADQISGDDYWIRSGFEKLTNKTPNAIFLEKFPGCEELDLLFSNTGYKLIADGCKGSNQIWSRSGLLEGAPFILVFNDSADERRIEIEIPLTNHIPYLLDLATKQSRIWPWYKTDKEKVKIYKDLNPFQISAFTLRETEEEIDHLVKTNSPVENVFRSQNGKTHIQIHSTSSEPIELTFKAKNLPKVVCNDNMKISRIQDTVGLWRIHQSQRSTIDRIILSNWLISKPGQDIEQTIDLSQGWETQGWDNYAGEGIYHCSFDLPALDMDKLYELELPRVETTAEVALNSFTIGKRGWEPFRFRLPVDHLKTGINDIQIRVFNSGANHYYHNTPYQPGGKTPSGLIGTPVINIYQILDIAI